VVLAYPVAWPLIAIGIGRYWRTAGIDGAVLTGWAAALTLLTLSGPFFPYPDRGTITLQIPLMLIAAGIYAARWSRVGWKAALAIVLLLGSSPMFLVKNWIARTTFSEAMPYKWLSDGHLAVIEELRARAGRHDVLLADQNTLRWLAPEYPGVHYAGHFFLTPGFAEKQAAITAFYTADPAAQAAFLRENRIRWVFIAAEHDPARFEQLRNLRTARKQSFGTLFEFDLSGAER
jgi:hypothetical protein